MKSLLRMVALIVAAALWLPMGRAQSQQQNPQTQNPQTQSQGAQRQEREQFGGERMREMEAHTVRGDITAIAGSTLTVKTEQGEVYSVETGPNTHFRRQRDPIQITDLHVGDMIGAFGDKDPKAHTLGAALVMVIDKARYEQMRATFGKTWTAGVVQSIDGTNIVVKRPDQVVQTIACDENTSFRRRREDVTLLDIKPGDTVTARGSLQNGAFLATLIRVGRAGGLRGAPGPATNQSGK